MKNFLLFCCLITVFTIAGVKIGKASPIHAGGYLDKDTGLRNLYTCSVAFGYVRSSDGHQHVIVHGCK